VQQGRFFLVQSGFDAPQIHKSCRESLTLLHAVHVHDWKLSQADVVSIVAGLFSTKTGLLEIFTGESVAKAFGPQSGVLLGGFLSERNIS